MLETPHVLLGAAIAVKTGNPLIAIPLAFASHFILEKVPHWNPHLNNEVKKYGKPTRQSTIIVIIDATTALISGSLIALSFIPDWKMVLTVLASCFFAVIPDLMEAPYFFLKKRNSVFIKKWITFQKSLQSNAPPLLGLLTQIITIAAILYWIG